MKNWITPGSAYTYRQYPVVRGFGFLLKPLYLVLAMWVVFWLDANYAFDFYMLGIFPREAEGLKGILLSPFVHGNLSHLGNNTPPMIVLGMALYYFYPRVADRVLLLTWISSGILVWLVGRDSYHIGASGLIYGLAGFIFLSGVLRKNASLLALSLVVAFMYGSLVWGVLPIEERISWEAHLAGGLSGFVWALAYRKVVPADYRPTPEPPREHPSEEEEIRRLEEKWGEKYWMQDQSEPRRFVFRYDYKPRQDEGSTTNQDKK